MDPNPAPQPQAQDLDTLDALRSYSVTRFNALHKRISNVEESVKDMSELFQNYKDRVPDIGTLDAKVMQLRFQLGNLGQTVESWIAAADRVGGTALMNFSAIRNLETQVTDLEDTLKVRASTVDLPTSVPNTVQQQLEQIKTTIKELQAKLGMPQDSTQEAASSSATTDRELRFH